MQWRRRNSLLLWGTLFWLGAGIGPALGQAETRIKEPPGRFDGTGHIVKGDKLSASKYVKGTSIEGSWSVLPTAPLEIGNRRQLLMDGYVVEDLAGCRRVVHRPRRHSGNPLITGGASLDHRQTHVVSTPSVVYDRERGLYRMWANGYRMYRTAGQHFGLYYESRDGLNWTAPGLNLHEIEGLSAPNVFFTKPGRSASIAVTELPENWRHKGRYLLAYHSGELGRNPATLQMPGGGMEVRIALSQDGIHFRDQEENPIFRGQSDCENQILYNPERKVFMLYRRPPINASRIRKIAYSESSDLINWTQPTVILRPDELDPFSFYGMTVAPYEGVYLGFLENFYYKQPYDLESKPAKHMQIDIQLAWSRDGIHWDRHPARPLFLETGPAGTYDWGMVFPPVGLIEREDRIDFYYVGREQLHVRMPGNSHICLATLRKDGFVSIEAPEEGFLLTRPLKHPGGRLHINAKTSAKGSVRVAVRRGDGELDGQWLPEWDYDRTRTFTGDSTNQVMEWSGMEDLESLKGKSIRLQFQLREAHLYSFWFE